MPVQTLGWGQREQYLTRIATGNVGRLTKSVNGGDVSAQSTSTDAETMFFVQAGEGAVFAIVPLVKRRMTGQIAGMAGAYGNVGAVTYLTVLSFVDYSTFFMVIGASALVIFFAAWFLDEPRGQIAEVMEDGTVHMIDVS